MISHTNFIKKYLNNVTAVFFQATYTTSFNTNIDDFICPFFHCTLFGNHLQRMSDKCSGGGIIWLRAVFNSLVLWLSVSDDSRVHSANFALSVHGARAHARARGRCCPPWQRLYFVLNESLMTRRRTANHFTQRRLMIFMDGRTDVLLMSCSNANADAHVDGEGDVGRRRQHQRDSGRSTRMDP